MSEVTMLAQPPTAVRPGSRSARTVIVLSGLVGRLAQVRSALGRNLIDLPGKNRRSLFDDWLHRLAGLLGSRGESSRVRVALDQDAPAPLLDQGDAALAFELERDASPTRGTAGVLRDITRDLPDDEQVLVVQASDLGWAWSEAEGAQLLDSDAEVVLSADRDLHPTGPLRVRAGLLKRIPSVGFVDLKEQFLPRCAASIEIVRSERGRVGGLHSRRHYLSLLGGCAEVAGADQPAGALPWRPDCAFTEPGVEVEPDAVLFESVALRGARIGKGAVVVRSIIGQGAVVPPGARVVDRTLVASGTKEFMEIEW